MNARAASRTRHRRAWLHIFLVGLLLWVLTTVATFVTGSSNLVPTVILLGSFLVPVTFVTYAFEHRTSDALGEHTIFTGFVYGGVLGMLGATLLEALFVNPRFAPSLFGVGLVEEGCKLAALWFVSRKLVAHDTRDGVVLGAAVGFGFAAFETAGYTFTALFATKGVSVGSGVATEVFRGILTPFGHGLWTAILGGVLFRRGPEVRPHLSWALVGCYVFVSLLHGLWDASFVVAGILGLLVVPVDAAAGGLALRHVWRSASRRVSTPPAVQRSPYYGARSPDGRWWWDDREWQPVPETQVGRQAVPPSAPGV